MRQPILTTEKKRIKGKWSTYHVIRWHDEHGKRRSKSLGNTNALSKTLARKALNEFKHKYNTDPAFKRDARCTIAQVWEAYSSIKRHELAPTTLTRYHGAVKHLCKHFGPNYPVERLTESGVAQFKAAMIQGELAKRSINAQSANGNMRSLKAVFNYAKDKLKDSDTQPVEAYAAAATAAQGWFSGFATNPNVPAGKPPMATLLDIDYEVGIANKSLTRQGDKLLLAASAIAGTPKDFACWGCHSVADLKKRGRSWFDPDQDVHYRGFNRLDDGDAGNDIAAAGRGYEYIADRCDFFHRSDFVTFHRGLQSADGIDFRYDNPCT